MRRESKERKLKFKATSDVRPKSTSRCTVNARDDKAKSNGPRLSAQNKSSKPHADEPTHSKIKTRRSRDQTNSVKTIKSDKTPASKNASGIIKRISSSENLNNEAKLELKASKVIKENFVEGWKSSSLDEFQRMLVVDSGNNASQNIQYLSPSAPVASETKEMGHIENDLLDINERTPKTPELITPTPTMPHAKSDEKLKNCSKVRNNGLIKANIMHNHSDYNDDPGSFTVYSSKGVTNEHSKLISSDLGVGLDFTSGINRQISSLNCKRQATRARDLLRIIELDLDDLRDLLDMPPIDEYSSYMLRFGLSGHAQVQTQTKDDSVTKDTQTEHLNGLPYESWTQVPPADESECAGHEFLKSKKC